MKELIGRNITLFFNLPTVFFLFSIVGLPVFVVIATSFTDWQLINKPDADFVWLENYIKPWQDERWVNAIGHTFYYSIATVLGQLLIGLLTALLFNRSFAGKAVYRSIWMMPMISMSVAISLVWLLFFDPPYGVLNYWITSIGLEPLEWTIDPVSAMPSLILVGIWHHTPFMTLILLSGLQSLPKEPFEAARIDGAKRWQMFLYITLPLMRGHIIIALVLRSVFAVKEFDTIIAITDAGPNWVTETMNLNIYFNAFEYQYLGEASAKGVIFFFMLIIIQVFLLHFRKREWTY